MFALEIEYVIINFRNETLRNIINEQIKVSEMEVFYMKIC